MSKYTNNCSCTHCGGDVTPHSAGDKIIYWCDNCGSNDDTTPPNINIKFEITKESE
jgi:Zn finger protein HypA/HybF involved in hydrogenase expression